PLMLRLPGRARAGERVGGVVHLVDIVPTVLAFAGAPPDPALPGCSLLAPVPDGRVVTGGPAPVQYLVQWPRKRTRAGKRIATGDLRPGWLEKDRKGVSRAEFEARRGELPRDPSSSHKPIPAAEMSPEDRAKLEALGYGGDGEGK